jgi:hypothetical protein
MSRSHVLLIGLTGVVGGLVGGCSQKDPAPGPAPAPAQVTTFAPKGCAYVVNHADVAQGAPPFEPHQDVASADPKLRVVRRGLGGGVEADKPGYASASTSFAIGWQTDDATKASKIRYGQSPDALTNVAEGFSYALEAKPGVMVRFHEVHVCGLEPGRTYHYQVGGGAPGAEVWSPVLSTTTAPAAGETVKIGFVGDTRDALGRSELPVWRAIASRYKAAAIPLALFSGDMVLVGLDQGMWDTWSKAAEDVAPTTFFALAPGNHENEQPQFFAHALMPGAASKNAERYSSFDYGPVHVVMIDDYPGVVAKSVDDTGHRAELLAWLDADLTKANANRAKVPFIVTFHHHPAYSDTKNTSRADEAEAVREAFLPLYEKHGVDLDLAGHDHFYERFQPLKGGAVDPSGTTYVICGAAGAPAYQIKPERPLAAQALEYDPDKGEGYYGIATIDANTFKAEIRKVVVGVGTSPNDDAVVDTFELKRR